MLTIVSASNFLDRNIIIINEIHLGTIFTLWKLRNQVKEAKKYKIKRKRKKKKKISNSKEPVMLCTEYISDYEEQFYYVVLSLNRE